MRRTKTCGVVLVLVLALSVSTVAWAQDGETPATRPPASGDGAYELTLAEALMLARENAPELKHFQMRVAEQEAGMVEASRVMRENPQVELGAGPRLGDAGTGLDFGLGVEQSFELGGGRDARVEATKASVARAGREVEDAARVVLAEVARAFFEARYAEELLEVNTASERLALDLHDVAVRRHDAGDIGVLDVHLTAVTLATTQAERAGIELRRERAIARLRPLLGLSADTSLILRGELLDRERLELSEVLKRAQGRSDLEVLTARAEEAEAEARASRVERSPKLGVGLEYAHEEGADIVMGTVSLSLPFFDQGQGAEATALARAATARVDREVAQQTIESDVRAAYERYMHMRAVVEGYERDALPHLEQSEALVRRSYEAGAMKLADVLAVHRELESARAVYSELLFNAARAGLELEVAAGVLP